MLPRKAAFPHAALNMAGGLHAIPVAVDKLAVACVSVVPLMRFRWPPANSGFLVTGGLPFPDYPLKFHGPLRAQDLSGPDLFVWGRGCLQH